MTGSASPLAAICGYWLPPKTGISSTRLVFGWPKRDRDRLRGAAGRTGDPAGFPSDLIQRMAGGRLKRLLSAPGGPTHNRRNPRRSAAAACIAASVEESMSEKIYDVSAEWTKRAWVDDAKYREMYARSVND